MATISGTISLTDTMQETPTGIPGGQPFYTSLTPKWAVASGTASDLADTKYVKTLTLSATPTALDLTNLTDPFGNSINFARVKSILVQNTATTSGYTVLMGYATTTTNAWTGLISNPGQLTIQPSSAYNNAWIQFVAPATIGWVVSSTSKLLQFDPGSNTIQLAIEIIGCSV
jgi:hypothetical protein